MSRRILSSLGVRLFSSSASKSTSAKDPVAQAFFQPEVQSTLRSLTAVNYSKIFRVARRGQHVSPPTYAFMTEKELKAAQAEAHDKAIRKLQMPPVMTPRTEETVVIDEDPAMKGFDAAKYMFTDISYGIHDRDRIIVVREPDGVLREALPDERDRLSQIYFPREGRRIKAAPMFDPENLEQILGPDRYIYILDRNCVQFEPDHPKYVKTAHMVYDHVDANEAYDILQSTRHYGPMVFHLVWQKRCDNLIIFYVKHQKLDEACKVVQLFTILHPESKVETVHDLKTEEGKLKMLRSYISNASNKETKVHVALESMLEARKVTDQILSQN